MRFSANLGYLFTELPLPDAIRAAKASGFDAVECQFPYDIDAAEISDVLAETGLPMLGLNTRPGDTFGYAALPDMVDKTEVALRDAIAYARQTGAPNIHVMAGQGGDDATFIRNLRLATKMAAQDGIAVLIEPINPRDVPGYHLSSCDHALRIMDAVAAPNLKLMFDCYHMQIIHGDVTCNLRRLLPVIGHVQIAAVPDRSEPDQGELDYGHILTALTDLGWDQPVGAEYRPRTTTQAGLGWLATFQNQF